jgi:hypothetical protein
MQGTPSIIPPQIPPLASNAARAEHVCELDRLRVIIVQMAAAWVQVSVTGLELREARRVVEAEVERLQTIHRLREDGL